MEATQRTVGRLVTDGRY